jgi:hypothetical protein
MPGLLIDRKILVKNNIYKLLDLSGFPPETNDDIGIVFLIKQKRYTSLLKISGGKEKIEYISSYSFLKGIYASYFIIYNKDKKICEIREHIEDEDIGDILDSLVEYLPKDVTIWIGVVPDNKTESYIKYGFDNPYITDRSPLKHTFENKGMSFSKTNVFKKTDIESVRNKFKYALKQSGDICNMYSRFTSKAISYLRKINDPTKKNQTELAGSLLVSKIVKKGSKTIFELSPDPKSVIYGSEDEVDAVWSRYNFHTHPKIAYDNYGVVRGWPSSQDFVGFLGLDNQTIFHTVVTLEGIYMISLSPEYTDKVSDVDKKFVLTHYDINHNSKISFNEYVKRINAKKYKRKQLFIIQYLPWKESTKEFPVYYKKTKDNCLATEEMYKMYNN